MRVSARCVRAAKPPAAEAKPESTTEVPHKPLRPAQCRAHMRKVLAEEFPLIVKGFVEGAKSGSCQHVKLATELLASKPRVSKPRRTSRIFDQWAEELEKGV